MNTLKIKIGLSLMVLSIGCPLAMGMDRWNALSLVESDNNDAAVGSAGEVSRFQIRPELWRAFFTLPPTGHPINPASARYVARTIMSERINHFESHFHRAPTDFEFYVLWNAPAEISKPSRAVRERARRFCNLTHEETLAKLGT